MTEYVVVSRSKHNGLFFDPHKQADQLLNASLAPVLLAELAQLLPAFALAFHWRDEKYSPVAILGLGERNAYLNQKSQWQSRYIPAVFRGYPFRLARQDTDQSVLCVNSGALDEKSGTPLFDDQGELSEPVQQVVNFLQKTQQNQQLTRDATDALQASGLLQPWPLALTDRHYPDGARIGDLFCIDQKALNALDNETFAGLRQSGALMLAYGQLFSMARVRQLQQRLEHADRAISANAAMPDFEQLFDGQDDSLEFSYDDT